MIKSDDISSRTRVKQMFHHSSQQNETAREKNHKKIFCLSRRNIEAECLPGWHKMKYSTRVVFTEGAEHYGDAICHETKRGP